MYQGDVDEASVPLLVGHLDTSDEASVPLLVGHLGTSDARCRNHIEMIQPSKGTKRKRRSQGT